MGSQRIPGELSAASGRLIGGARASKKPPRRRRRCLPRPSRGMAWPTVPRGSVASRCVPSRLWVRLCPEGNFTEVG